jgi:hypothetical protein
MGDNKRGAVLSGLATLLNAHAPHAHAVLMTVRLGKNADKSLIEVSTQDGSWQLIDQGKPETAGWVIDVHGNSIAREDWDAVHHAYRVLVWREGKLRELLRRDDALEQLDLAGALPDGSALVVLTPNGRPHQVAWAYPLDGSPPHVLVEDPDTEVTGVFLDPYSGSVLGVFLGVPRSRPSGWTHPRSSVTTRYSAPFQTRPLHCTGGRSTGLRRSRRCKHRTRRPSII